MRRSQFHFHDCPSVFGIMGVLCTVAFLGFLGCERKSDSHGWDERPGPNVLVSFPPLYSFALSVAGDDAQVKVLLTGAGPHANPDPTTQQLRLAQGANLTFVNGLGMDDATAKKIQRALGSTPGKLVLLGDQLDPKILREAGGHHHDHDAGEAKDDDHHHAMDPHVWLGIEQAKGMVAIIRDELKKADPPHASNYENRAAAYQSRLDQLQKDGREMLKGKTERKIISFHDSLGYFAHSYGLTIAGVVQLEPGHEPSPEHIKDLIRLCTTEKVRVIAVEPQFKRDHAEMLLQELRREYDKDPTANAAIKNPLLVEIDPLETADSGELTADLYERKMRLNLENLKNVLK